MTNHTFACHFKKFSKTIGLSFALCLPDTLFGNFKTVMDPMDLFSQHSKTFSQKRTAQTSAPFNNRLEELHRSPLYAFSNACGLDTRYIKQTKRFPIINTFSFLV
ncbi:MAG: hypothetical protein HFE39_04975 [Clostridiales bacterium]|nr:hypothetical protein [Clostridiales bacterium]